MADANVPSSVDSSLPNLAMREVGTLGLKTDGTQIYEELRKELRFPNACQTYRSMEQDATINSGLNLFAMMIGQVEWKIDKGVSPDEKMEQKAEFLRQVLNDMDVTLEDIIKSACTSLVYGFATPEIVYRYRRFDRGSKYNDNKVGIKGVYPRSQDTVVEWKFSPDGRKLLGLYQDATVLTNPERYTTLINGKDKGKVFLPRHKFLHFRIGGFNGNPEGQSPLRACFMPWFYRTRLEEQEAVGVFKDMNGIPVIYLPPRYMSENASDEDKAIYDYYKKVINQLNMNEQAGLILPQVYDPDARAKLFEFQLVSTTGSKLYDTDKIIRRWDNKILQALFADMLKLGQDQVGSYNLAGAKTDIMSLAIKTRLLEFKHTLNDDFVKPLFKYNGYDMSEPLPELTFGRITAIDLEEFSKAIQRILSTSGVELDRETLNLIRTALGLKPRPEDEEPREEYLPKFSSRAGDGLRTAGEGTSKSPSARDESVSNQEN